MINNGIDINSKSGMLISRFLEGKHGSLSKEFIELIFYLIMDSSLNNDMIIEIDNINY